MRFQSLGYRRVAFTLAVAGVVAGLGWLMTGTASPFRDEFLDHVTGPNWLGWLNLPAFLISVLLSGNVHTPAPWAVVTGFLAQWLSVSFLLSLVIIRPASRGASRFGD